MSAKPIETAEITVQYVNPPKEGRKWGSVKSAEGHYYYGPPQMLSVYQPGEVCKIEYEMGGNDGQLRTLKRKLSQTPPALARPTPSPPRQRTNPTDSEQMFVTALLKEMVVETDTSTSIIQKGKYCSDAYDVLFGSVAKQTTEAELNDAIPDF